MWVTALPQCSRVRHLRGCILRGYAAMWTVGRVRIKRTDHLGPVECICSGQLGVPRAVITLTRGFFLFVHCGPCALSMPWGSCPCPGVEMRESPPLAHHFVCVETFTLTPYLTLALLPDGYCGTDLHSTRQPTVHSSPSPPARLRSSPYPHRSDKRTSLPGSLLGRLGHRLQKDFEEGATDEPTNEGASDRNPEVGRAREARLAEEEGWGQTRAYQG